MITKTALTVRVWKAVMLLLAVVLVVIFYRRVLVLPSIQIGSSREVVDKILGQPERRRESADALPSIPADCKSNQLAYALVYRCPLGRVLVVYFNKSDRVICVASELSVVAY